MLKQVDGKIGIREYFALVTFCIATKASDNTSTLLLKSGENATWIMVILSGIIMIIIYLTTLSLLKSYKDKNLIEITYSVFGKFLGFVFGCVIITSIFASITINSRTTVNILNAFFFPTTPPMIHYIILLGGSWFIAKRGFEAIGRGCWMFLPYAIVSILLLIATTMKEMDLSSIFPIAGPGVTNLFKGGFLYSSIFADIIVLTLFFPFVRTYKAFTISSLLGLFFSVATLSLFTFAFSSLYGYNVLNLLNYPFQALARASHIGRFANNIDAAYLIMWAIGSLLHYSIYLYALATALGYVFRFMNFERFLLPCILVIPVIGMIPKNNVNITYFFRDSLLKSASYFFVFFPLLLFLVSKLRGDKAR